MSELQGLQLSLDAFRREGVTVIGVSVDPVERNRQVVERHGFDYALLADTEGRAMDAFGVRHEKAGLQGEDVARPATFVLAGGAVRWRDLTDNWRARPHADEVLAAAVEAKATAPR
jgi:peroxiredoxin Q/BCP